MVAGGGRERVMEVRVHVNCGVSVSKHNGRAVGTKEEREAMFNELLSDGLKAARATLFVRRLHPNQPNRCHWVRLERSRGRARQSIVAQAELKDSSEQLSVLAKMTVDLGVLE